MKIKIDSKIYIKNPSVEMKNYIEKELCIVNPEIQKKHYMGFWTGNLPKYIKMYSKNADEYVVPIGEIDNVWKLHPVKEDYEINFGKHKKLDFPIGNIKLYNYQEKAVQEMLKVKRGILSSKCGTGKSIMVLELIRRIGYKALIICEKKEILQQFIGYLRDIYNMQEGEYGTIAEGKVELGSLVTVALRQTLAKIDLTEYKFEFGCICVDEGQNVGGSVTKCTQYAKILNNLAAEYRYAVSATAYRVDGLTRCMYSLLNTIKYEIPKDAIASKVIKAKIQPIYTNFEIPYYAQNTDGTIDYVKLPTVLAEDKDRNELILELLRQNKDNYCLILSDRLSGLKYLHEQLGAGLMIDGSMTSKKAKQEREEAIKKMRNKEEHYLFATFSLAREGLDIKPLNRLFLIAPTKNKITLIQSVGRIERIDEGKERPIVYDFVDNDLYFQKAFKSRKTIYKKNGNTILT